ncbi:hypothetical protein QTP88_011408 [Uroleucon formosanum]
MASTLVFSASEDEILIQEVQKNSILFNIRDKNYKNIILKDIFWKDISLKLGKSMDVTKKRWKNIRDSYSRNKRKPSTGSAASIKKKWTLAPHLGFLEQVEWERSSTSNVTQTQELGSFAQELDTSNQGYDTSNQDLDTTHLVEDKNEECYETDDNAPKQTFSKERGPTKNQMADLFVKRSNERNLLIKKMQDQNEQILMKQNNQLDDMDLFKI